MALLTVPEQRQCDLQGAWGSTMRCDNPGCGLVITQPYYWVGKAHRVFHSRECKEAVEGVGISKFIKKQYKQGDAGAAGVIPFMGSDVDRIEQEIMKQVIANPHSKWNVTTCLRLFKGTDNKAVRAAVHNLLAEQSLYKVGSTMSILRATEYKEQVKTRRQEARLEIREKKQRKRLREKRRLKREKKDAREAARMERIAAREAAKQAAKQAAKKARRKGQ